MVNEVATFVTEQHRNTMESSRLMDRIYGAGARSVRMGTKLTRTFFVKKHFKEDHPYTFLGPRHNQRHRFQEERLHARM